MTFGRGPDRKTPAPNTKLAAAMTDKGRNGYFVEGTSR
jgi:hypothetical protein